MYKHILLSILFFFKTTNMYVSKDKKNKDQYVTYHEYFKKKEHKSQLLLLSLLCT